MSTGQNTKLNTKKRGNPKGNPQNLMPAWKPGQSGNPTGRPVGARSFETVYKEALKNIAKAKNVTPEELEEYMQEVGLNKAMEGDYRFYQDFQDRLYGKPTQRIENTHEVIPNQTQQVNNLLDDAL